MKVIIVDDEPKAISLLSSYLSHYSKFTLVGSFRNGLKAIEYIDSNEVDAIFLDINMPHLSGLSLAKMLDKKIAVIFTTAYSEHAVESYAIEAVDYLLKPISLERFAKSITKLIAYNNLMKIKGVEEKKLEEKLEEKSEKRILIKSGLETHQVKINEILFLKKDGNYMYYHLLKNRIMARESIREAMAKLPNNFIQVHKSYLVNLDGVDKINSEFIYINSHKIPIGLQYKQDFLKRLNSY